MRRPCLQPCSSPGPSDNLDAMPDDEKDHPDELSDAQKLFNKTRLDTETKAAKITELERRSREADERKERKDREDR